MPPIQDNTNLSPQSDAQSEQRVPQTPSTIPQPTPQTIPKFTKMTSDKNGYYRLGRTTLYYMLFKYGFPAIILFLYRARHLGRGDRRKHPAAIFRMGFKLFGLFSSRTYCGRHLTTFYSDNGHYRRRYGLWMVSIVPLQAGRQRIVI